MGVFASSTALSTLSAAGRAFLREFGGALLVLIPGVLAAPNFSAGKGLAIAAIIASLGAGIRALQEFVPALSISAWVIKYSSSPFAAQAGAVADTALRAFVGSVLAFLPGILAAPNFDDAKALAVAGIIAAAAAAVRAVQAIFTPPNPPAQPVV